MKYIGIQIVVRSAGHTAVTDNTQIAAIQIKLERPRPQFTYPGISMGTHEFNAHGDVYFNVVNDFSIPWVVMVYIAAQIVLGLHLYHGGWSLLQSLGLTHPAVNEKRRTVAQAIAALVVIGNISIPVAVLAGFVTY